MNELLRTDACPECFLPVSSHNDQIARVHYQRWQRSLGCGEERNPVRVFCTDESPVIVGEYDGEKFLHVGVR